MLIILVVNIIVLIITTIIPQLLRQTAYYVTYYLAIQTLLWKPFALTYLQNYQKIGHTSWTEFFQISKELTRHAEERHNVFGTEVETCFSLQCSGCTEKYELPGELKFWDEHMENMPCKNRRFKSR